MQNKDSFFELHGIHGTIGATPIVFTHLKHSGAANALEHLRRIMLITGLSKETRVTEEPPYIGRSRHQAFKATAYPFERPFADSHILIIHEQVYSASTIDASLMLQTHDVSAANHTSSLARWNQHIRLAG